MQETIVHFKATSCSENQCEEGFVLFFMMTSLVLFLAGFGFGGDFPSDRLLALAFGLLVVAFCSMLARRIYRRYLGPVLVARGWNEYSFAQSVKLILLLMATFWLAPIVALHLFFRFW